MAPGFLLPRHMTPAPSPMDYVLSKASLDSTHEQQNHENEDHQAQPAARIVSPAAAIRPRRNATEKQNNQQDDEQQEHICIPPLVGTANTQPLYAAVRALFVLQVFGDLLGKRRHRSLRAEILDVLRGNAHAEMRRDMPQKLQDGGHLPLGQQIDLQIQMAALIGPAAHPVLLHPEESGKENSI